MGVIADLHAQQVRDRIEAARLYHAAAMGLSLGCRVRVKPGWRRPTTVDVVRWADRTCGLATVRCVDTGRVYLFPEHQLERIPEAVPAQHGMPDDAVARVVSNARAAAKAAELSRRRTGVVQDVTQRPGYEDLGRR
jgi:hypothetical protein